MKQETADRINAIYLQLFYDEKYKMIAKDFNDAIAVLERYSEQIPDDLWLLVEEASTRANREEYDPHSLGEFDFANGSGWMFSINGDYPNYGFSDAYFLDGDVVRIRYTLHYGKDIAGFGGMGGGSGSNWDKEW